MAQDLINSDDDFASSQLSPRTVRRTYLVTYSQADLVKFPSRQSFGEAVVNTFNSGSGKVKVEFWACSREDHKDGGKHYHLSLKLSAPKRWKGVKDKLVREHGIVVNFSDRHDHYYSAYQYTSKNDTETFKSEGHPDLDAISAPRTTKAIVGYRQKKSRQREENPASSSSGKVKRRRLTPLEVSNFIVKKNLHSEIELYAEASRQKAEGKEDLAGYIFNRTSKNINELLANTWKMHQAERAVQRGTQTRLNIVKECATTSSCTDVCGGKWLQLAREILRNNNINPYVYADALRQTLLKGRGKKLNILIAGPANCGKTFMLSPLKDLFQCFCNPANDKYAWVGAEKSEIIFLNDFRWTRELISWKDLLLLLEGDIVNLPSPKNHFAVDVCIKDDTPIFATSIAKITKSMRDTDVGENDMMDARWKVYEFFHVIPEEKQVKIPPCANCFSKLTLLGDEE